MLVSDHGWHLGEKKHWCKGAIWEQTTHIPFIVRGPRVGPGTTCTQPVSLIDVYPSLVDLAGLRVPGWLDGTSVKPQLADPSTPRPPAISSYGEANTSIRTERWRYIRYEDGSEELYDHTVDPDEWTNLANKPEHKETKRRLAKMIPENQHPGLKVQSWFDKHQITGEKEDVPEKEKRTRRRRKTKATHSQAVEAGSFEEKARRGNQP